MRTYPIVDDRGLMYALEIENAYIGSNRLASVLAGVPGVSSVQPRKAFAASGDTRVTFLYRGVPFVVTEPFGDSSRYWIGPEDPEVHKIDLDPLERTLSSYQPSRVTKAIGDLLSLRFKSPFQQ